MLAKCDVVAKIFATKVNMSKNVPVEFTNTGGRC